MLQSILSLFREILNVLTSIGLAGLLGIWGAILSTCLAYVKFLEFRRERPQLSTTYSFISDPNHGNQVIIQNSSKTPVIISHWELIWQKKRLFKTEATETIDYGYLDDRRDIIIGAHDTHTLTFQEQDHFQWGYKTAEKGILYLQLHIAGRAKPVMLKVYDPIA